MIIPNRCCSLDDNNAANTHNTCVSWPTPPRLPLYVPEPNSRITLLNHEHVNSMETICPEFATERTVVIVDAVASAAATFAAVWW